MFPLQLARQWSKDRKSLSVTARDTSLGEEKRETFNSRCDYRLLANEKLRDDWGGRRRFFASNFFATSTKIYRP